MTFIRKLVADMGTKFGNHAEVKTFHAYCKKVLHAQNGKVEIAPFLTKLIEKDAELLANNLSHFDARFQTLDEASPQIAFHLKRGDYYEAVGFDDSVYRLYKMLQRDAEILPAFDQIVIDEFQDFHQLEVAFIHELSKKGDILIVGDDDQAVLKNLNCHFAADVHKSLSAQPTTSFSAPNRKAISKIAFQKIMNAIWTTKNLTASSIQKLFWQIARLPPSLQNMFIRKLQRLIRRTSLNQMRKVANTPLFW
jgi:hypothetical protein